MSNIPSQPMSNAMVLSNANPAQGGCSISQYRHSPYQAVSATQVTAYGVTAFKRLKPPVIPTANTIDREEGLIGYDPDSERLCYTDSNLVWRCMAIVDDLPDAGSHDMTSAMLLVTNVVSSAAPGFNVPTVGYHRLTDWTTAAPRIASVNWDNATGIYTAADEGNFQVNVQVSWRETQRNQGIRVLRIIHTDGALTETIMAETVTNPSPNRQVNTVQQAHAGVAMVPGDTIHVEVAQTSCVDKDVEGGATVGSSGTTIQIMQVT